MTDNRRDGYGAPLGVVSSSPTSNAVALVERLKATMPVVQCGPGAEGFGEKVERLVNPDGPEAADLIQSLAARIAELEGERDEARLLVIEANNSLFGSQGYFHSLKGGPFDKYHLARAIEDMKARSNELWRKSQALLSEEG